jgi:hypothetical protein
VRARYASPVSSTSATSLTDMDSFAEIEAGLGNGAC